MNWDDPASSYDGGLESHATFEPGPPIGRGGEGVVFSGRDRRLPREVAWKTAHHNDVAAQARLRQEARVLAMLEHPSIVPIYDLVDDEGELRMATRHVRGETLRAFIHRNAGRPEGSGTTGQTPDPIARGLRHILATAEALAFAHSRGVVHRDVKPDNIMVGSFGETQLIDWGFAVVSGDPVQLGAVVGTACHMSPEQARGEHPQPSLDVWGLGTTLFELVARRPLFSETHGQHILERLVLGDRPALSLPGLSKELLAILERALAPHLEYRYPDARAFADDLSAYIDGRIVSAYIYRNRDRVLRFMRAHRVAGGIAIAVLVMLVLGLPVAFERIGAERDTAIAAREERTAALIRAETTVAQREHAAGQRPEAELAAANVLELSESPEARGIIAAFGRAPHLERVATVGADALRDGCRDLAMSADGRHLLCGQRTGLVVHRLSNDPRHGGPVALTPVIALRAPYRSATVTDDGLWVSYQGLRGPTFIPFGGGARRIFQSCARDLRAVGNLVLDTASQCAVVLTPERAQHVPLLPSDEVQIAASDGRSHFVLLTDGTLVTSRARGGGAHVTRLQTDLRSSTREYVSAALLPATAAALRLVFGTTRGMVIVIDGTLGTIVAKASLGPDRMVRDLSIDAARNRLLARVDAGGIILLDASSLAVSSHLPRTSNLWAQFLGDGTLVSFGSSLSFWHIPDGPVAGFDGLVGVTSLAFFDDRLIVTHDRSATLMQASNGSVLASRIGSGPDAEVIKGAAIRGPDIIVASAKAKSAHTAPPRLARASPEPRFETWWGLRRLISLTDGRLVGASSSNGLYFEHPNGVWTLLDPWRQTDLALRGDLLAHLSSTPALVSVWDLSGPPLRLSSCPDEGSTAVGLVDDPDGVIVLTAHSRWVVATRDCSILKIFATPAEPSRVVGIGPTETGFVAAGTRDGEVLVWDWSGTLRARVLAHLEPVSVLTVDPTGRWLVSGAWDGRVRFLDLGLVAAPAADLVATIRRAWTE